MAIALHYFRSDPPNFGDELNALIWPALIPGLEQSEIDGVLVGIGTILDSSIPQHRNVFVLGSGAGLARLPPGLEDGTLQVLAVRGPLTARLAGLPMELAVTDPALLIRAVYPQLLALRNRAGAGQTLFVPHFTTAKDPGWRRACTRAGIAFVEPSADCVTILKKIASARLVIAEAMHAAIVADALRVPWIPVASTRQFSTFKWVDWALSLQVPFRPTLLPAVSARHAVQRAALNLFAERCLVESVSTDGTESALHSEGVAVLLRETAQRLGMQQSGPLRSFKMKAAAVHQHVIDPLVARLGHVLFRASDAVAEKQVARILSDLAATPGYCSTDEMSTARLHSLQEKVECLRDRLASDLRPGTAREHPGSAGAGTRRKWQRTGRH